MQWPCQVFWLRKTQYTKAELFCNEPSEVNFRGSRHPRLDRFGARRKTVAPLWHRKTGTRSVASQIDHYIRPLALPFGHNMSKEEPIPSVGSSAAAILPRPLPLGKRRNPPGRWGRAPRHFSRLAVPTHLIALQILEGEPPCLDIPQLQHLSPWVLPRRPHFPEKSGVPLSPFGETARITT